MDLLTGQLRSQLVLCMWRFKGFRLICNNKGFLLVEVAIALVIVGMIIGFGMPRLMSYLDWSKRKESKERQEKILHSVAACALHNGYVPLPADPAEKDPNQFGKSRPSAHSTEDMRGIVPFKTLDLPPEYAKDGFNRYFTYVGGWGQAYDQSPDPSAFSVSLEGSSYYGSSGANNVDKIVRATLSFPIEVSSALDAKEIVVLLISHGSKGNGAFMGSPGRIHQNLTADMGKEERKNATGLKFTDHPLSLNKQDYFDHQIIWVTGRNLMAIYAKATINPPASIPDLGAYRNY